MWPQTEYQPVRKLSILTDRIGITSMNCFRATIQNTYQPVVHVHGLVSCAGSFCLLAGSQLISLTQSACMGTYHVPAWAVVYSKLSNVSESRLQLAHKSKVFLAIITLYGKRNREYRSKKSLKHISKQNTHTHIWPVPQSCPILWRWPGPCLRADIIWAVAWESGDRAEMSLLRTQLNLRTSNKSKS